MADPMLRHHFRLGNIVTVVDAVAGAENLDRYSECLRQAVAADRLVISKVDLVPPGQAAALGAQLRGLNPAATIVEASEASDISAALLMHDIHDEAARASEVRTWLAAAEHAHQHDSTDPNRHGDVRAFVLTAAAPLDWARFGLWLSMLLNRHGTSILRLKGLVAIGGQAEPVLIQGVQHLVHKPMHLKAWPEGDRRTRLVVIVRGLDPRAIERSFRAFMQLGQAAERQVASSA
jgi:G3E family GTPase